MVMFLLGGLLAFIVVAVLSVPLWRNDHAPVADDEGVGLYRDQLAELDRDRARGVLTDDQTGAARTEVERRLLAALRRRDAQAAGTSRFGRLAAICLVGLTPLLAGAVYLGLGRPDMPSAPFSGRRAALANGPDMAAGTHPEMRDRIAELEARLAAAPDDVEGQALLARSYASVGDYGRAREAYAAANRLAGGADRQLAGEFAEVMVVANGGDVPPESRAIFARINAEDPNDPQSSYYLALAKAQSGDVPGAVAALTRLRAASPPDAPWLPTVDGLLAELDPAAVLSPMPSAPPAPGPTPEMIAAASTMPADAQAEMIRGMVDGLAERLETERDDVDGWRRLARAYEVLGETDRARAAHSEVLRLAPDDAAARAFLDAQ